MKRETWKAIPGYIGEYEVSDMGRVRSLARTIIRANGVPQYVNPRVLRPARTGKSGHVSVSLRRLNSIHVHRLVLLAFSGSPKNGEEALHRNHQPSDNRLLNLYWGTRSQNLKMDYENGSRQQYCTAVRMFLPCGSEFDFPSATDAARYIGVTPSAVQLAVRMFWPLRKSKAVFVKMKVFQ